MATDHVNQHENPDIQQEIDETTALREWFGVVSDDPTHYEILGIKTGEDDFSRIETAARARVAIIRSKLRTYPRALCEQLQTTVLAARATLIDQKKRDVYNASRGILPLLQPDDPFAIPLEGTIPARPPQLHPRRRPASSMKKIAGIAGGVAAGTIAIGAALFGISRNGQDDKSPDADRPAASAKDTLPPSPPVAANVAEKQETTRTNVQEVTVQKPITPSDAPPPPPPAAAQPAAPAPQPAANAADRAPILPKPVAPEKKEKENAGGKLPIPSRERMASLRADPDFAEELRGSAHDLLVHSQKQKDPERIWVLLRDGYDAAVKENDIEAAWAALESMSAFDIQPVNLARQRMKAFAEIFPQATGPQRRNMLAMAPDLLGHAVAYDRFDEFDVLAGLTKTALLRDPVQRKRFSGIEGQATALAEQYAETAKAREVLATNPDDPQANGIMGTYYALTKGDGQMAVSFLEKAADEKLRELGEKMRGGSTDAQQCLDIARSFLQHAEQLDDRWKKGAQRMAAAYCKRAAARGNVPQYEKAVRLLASIPRGARDGATPFHPLLDGEPANGRLMQHLDIMPDIKSQRVMGEWTSSIRGQKLPGTLAVSGVQTDATGIEILAYLYIPVGGMGGDYRFATTVQQVELSRFGVKHQTPDAVYLDLPIGPQAMKSPSRVASGHNLNYSINGIFGVKGAPQFLKKDGDPRHIPGMLPSSRLDHRVFVRNKDGKPWFYLQILFNGTPYAECEAPVGISHNMTQRHIPKDKGSDGVGLGAFTTPALFSDITVDRPFMIQASPSPKDVIASRNGMRTASRSVLPQFGEDGLKTWAAKQQQNQRAKDEIRKRDEWREKHKRPGEVH